MAKKNTPGCICCADPPFCCDDSVTAIPPFVQIAVTGVSGAAAAAGCTALGISCSTEWNTTRTLSLWGQTGAACGWSLFETAQATCHPFPFSCDAIGKFWQLTVRQESGTWIQRLVITTSGYSTTFGPLQGESVVFKYSYASQPECDSIDMDQSLPWDSGNTCCNFASAAAGVTVIP